MVIDKSQRRFLIALLIAMSGLAAGTAQAASFEAPAGKALVYLIQGETQNFANVPVYVDRRSIGTLKANSYLAFSADPGAHLISASGAGTSSFRLTVNAGKTYYVSQRINAGGIPVFRPLTEGEAQPLLSGYRAARGDVVATGGTAAAPPAATAERPAKPAPRRAAAPLPRPAHEHFSFVLAAKSGVFKLSKTSQNWLDIDTTVDDSASGPLGLELAYRSAEGWSIGGEYLAYENSWTQANGGSGNVSTTAYMLNGKVYFNNAGTVHPYLGVGVGSGSTKFSGNITGTPTGAAYQIFGGVEFQFHHVGAFLELKMLSVDAEGNRAGGGTVSVDTGGTGLFAGVSAHF